MSSARNMRRAKEKLLKKEMKKTMRGAEQAISNLPEKCDECSAPFDRTIQSELDKWRVAVYDDGRIHLVCEDCVPESVKTKNDPA